MTAVATRIIRVDPDCPDDKLLRPAADALRAGQLVAFPTETVYGLGANALDPAALAAVFTVKGRPADNPLILHIASIADLPALTSRVPELAEKLFKAFSPGPLTLVMPRSSAVPDLVTAGLDTVAIRIPAHPVARRLIELAGVPVAAPSANRSGRPSPTRSWHVETDLDGRIPYIVDGGSCEFGLESTVVDVTGQVPVILRPGAITAEQIRAVAGAVSGGLDGADSDQNEAPRSPGMKYRHYAPKASVLIAEGTDPASRARFAAFLSERPLVSGERLGFFGSEAFLARLPWPVSRIDEYETESEDQAGDFDRFGIAASDQPDASRYGALFFDALRRLDQLKVSVIIAEALPEDGAAAAYMNRLRKAAGHPGEEDVHE